MQGKNVLQQLFTVVSRAPAIQQKQLIDLTKVAAPQPVEIQLSLEIPADQLDEVCIEMNPNAPDSEIPADQLVQAKSYLDHEQARAMLFGGVEFSASEWRDIEEAAAAKVQQPGFFEAQGVTVLPRPMQCESPGRANRPADGAGVPKLYTQGLADDNDMMPPPSPIGAPGTGESSHHTSHITH
jgi:hypothetical protein